MNSTQILVSELAEMPRDKFADWLINGFLDYHLDKNVIFPFKPYNSITGAMEPADKIQELGNSGISSLKKKIISAAPILLNTVIVKVEENSNLDMISASNLLNDAIWLCSKFPSTDSLEVLYNAAHRIEQTALSEDIQKDIFQACLLSIGELVRGANSSNLLQKIGRTKFTTSIYNLKSSKFFDKKFSPFLLNTLIILQPSKLYEHLELLSKEIELLHIDDFSKHSKEAHLTAEFIVQNCLRFLKSSFHKFEFSDNFSNHYWLVWALTCKSGPLMMIRTEKISSPKIIIRINGSELTLPPHQDWIYFEPEDPSFAVSEDNYRNEPLLEKAIKDTKNLLYGVFSNKAAARSSGLQG